MDWGDATITSTETACGAALTGSSFLPLQEQIITNENASNHLGSIDLSIINE
jgi:hypothetical protein